MQIKVNENPKRFYLSIVEKGWVAFVGHEIQVGELKLAVIPMDNGTNTEMRIIEVETGGKLFSLYIYPIIHDDIIVKTSTKEGAMEFYRDEITKRIVSAIEQITIDVFKERIEQVTKELEQKFGKKPPTENVDEDLILVNTDGNSH